MNIRAKSSLILIFTLIIGILLGVLVDRTLLHRSFEQRIARMRGPGGFIHLFERVLEPTEAQKEKIRKVLDSYSERLTILEKQSRKNFTAVMDSLIQDLQPILSDEQKQRLKELIERRGKRRAGRGRPHGPPPERDQLKPDPERREFRLP